MRADFCYWCSVHRQCLSTIVQCATVSKSLNPRNIDKTVLDILVRNRFPFESSFWISVSGCKLTILPDTQPENRIVIISAGSRKYFFCSAKRKSATKIEFVCSASASVKRLLRNSPHPQFQVNTFGCLAVD